VLPLYFKHSKYPSFVRQLNFYSFHKLREDCDVTSDTKVVRFAHEFFRRGNPELLHRIERSTKAAEPETKKLVSASDQAVESLKHDIAEMNERLHQLSHFVDFKMKAFSLAIEEDYHRRMKNIALSYDSLSKLIPTPAGNSHLTSTHAMTPTLLPESADLTGSPLLALSDIASMFSGSSSSEAARTQLR
jgi:hypothetical protein